MKNKLHVYIGAPYIRYKLSSVTIPTYYTNQILLL